MAFRAPAAVITETVARNTIIVFYVCLVISSCSVVVLFPKSRNVICRRERKRRQHVPSPTSFPGLSETKKVGEYRVVLLTIASVLMLAESCNSLVYYHTLWETGNANSFALNLVRVVTIYTASPIVATATLYRTAIIIVMQQKLRLLCIRAFLSTTCAIMVAVYVIVTQNVLRHANLDIVEWQSAAIIPQWTAALLALFPIMLITMSLWSLKIAFGAIPPPNANEAAIMSMAPVSLTNSLPGTNAANSVGKNSSAPDYGSLAKEPVSNPQMALGRTFKVLTMCILSYWVMFLVIIALFRPFPIHSTAITCTLVALAVATEASFEWLMVQSAKVDTHRASSMMLLSSVKSKMGSGRAAVLAAGSKSVTAA